MKTLLIMRHAKAETPPDYPSDFERPLADRGRKDACFTGNLFKSKNIVPDMIISSPAKRAIKTAELFAENIGFTEKIVQNKDFYEAYMEDILSVLKTVPENINTLMIVGHNPTWENLASRLTGEYVSMPTCAVAIIDFKKEKWSEITFKTCTLSELFKPKDF